MLAVAALLGGFVGVVLWFDRVDFYHKHFFDTGAIVFADNVMRIVFVGIFSWLIYAPGAAVVALVTTPAERAALSPAERAVLGFGIGVGIWHVVMLILGVLDLYYRSVLAGLCFVVLAASSRHFAHVAVAGCRALADRFTALRQRRVSPQEVGAILIVVVAAWLLLRRGLFPGGSGDYYTHYFYYYLEVLKNHGLEPNDVWYHYYYSKGCGLAFLGMLLTDPEAPALTTFPCVIFAAVAIATLAARMAPGSLWPAAGALIYLLYYLLNFNGIGAGEFQKDHEEVAALVVLTVWALCMERCAPPLPFRVMAASSAIAAAIVTQAVGVLLSVFVGLLGAWSMLHRRWREMWGYGVVAATIAVAVLAMFVLSYVQTGLASDQALDLMLRFADVSRLDRWGVIPQVIAVAWIRDNYLALVPPFGWADFKQLFQFMRLRGLWPFLIGPIIAAIIICMMDRFAPWKRLAAQRSNGSRVCRSNSGEARRPFALLHRHRALGRARAKHIVRKAQHFFCSLAGAVCNCLRCMAGQWQATVSRRSVDVDGAARRVARRGARRVAGQGPLVETIARGNGQCLALFLRPLQPGRSLRARWRLPLWRDQSRCAQRRATIALRYADLEHQCGFLLHGTRLPDRKLHFLQDVRAVG